MTNKKFLGQNEAFLTDNGLLIGNRIPRHYFITEGCGESNITIHAGSYHLALRNAGIEWANIMTYSSVLPPIAKEIKKPKNFNFGEVMETIMAVAHGKEGETISAGIITGTLFDKENSEKFGGFVCEFGGVCSEEEIKETLKSSIFELYENGYSETHNLKDLNIYTKTFTPEKKFGSVLVALCFKDYFIPYF